MSGLYLHIPFCRKACHYCNFHFSTQLSNKARMVDALVAELRLRREELDQALHTLYWGGGTPSLLSVAEMDRLLNAIAAGPGWVNQAEITLEANPDDLHPNQLKAWKSLGFNRLSLGVQSFHEAHLQWMNRAHSAQQAHQAIQWALAAGFEKISIDLIYGLPQAQASDWRKDLATVQAYGLGHVSAYALTVEPQTALGHRVSKGQETPVDPDAQAAAFEELLDWAAAAGYEDYEISNLALPGQRSQHNSAYWEGLPYVGIGPSAHSFRHNERSWNVANNALYLQGMEKGERIFEQENLRPTDLFNEYLMTALRRKEGVAWEKTLALGGSTRQEKLKKDLEKFVQEGLIILSPQGFQLTRSGKFLADGIAADLFQLDQ